MRRMLCAMAWIIVCGAGVTQAATVTSSFNFVGQSFGGEDVSVEVPIGNNVRPVGDATLDLSIRGDYDTMNELVTVSLDGTAVGQAGTTMDGTFLGTNVTTNGPGDISFMQSLVISLEDLMSAFDGDGVATLLFDRSSNVGGGANSQISGTLTFAAVPEPSTMALTSLGLVCAACCYTIRRRRPAVQRSSSV